MSDAKYVAVRKFRGTFLWPLALDREHDSGDDSTATLVQESWKRIEGQGKPWQRVHDGAAHVPPPSQVLKTASAVERWDALQQHERWQSQVQGEGHYFHDFIADVLFRQGGGPEDFRLYQRTDIKRVEVAWKNGCRSPNRALNVLRLNLYVFRTGAAVLVLELEADNAAGQWTLADVQDFHERFRRTYAPYTHDDLSPGGIVSSVTLIGAEGNTLKSFKFDAADHRAAIEAYIPRSAKTQPRRTPAILGHWIHMLGGALPLKQQVADTYSWMHIADDRLPTLLAVSVTAAQGDPKAQYNAIRRGDFIRLCFGDYASSSPYPYDEEVLRDFEARHAYDWFRSDGTRFLVSGPAFVAIGAGWFFDTYVLDHMRRHYFQMGLLLHVEMASLLAFSRAISRSALALQSDRAGRNDSAGGQQDRFARNMRRLQEEHLQFVHRFHFTGVSHQMQGQALFELWRERLGLRALFADLQTEISASNQFLQAEWERGRTEAANRLAAVAAVGVAVGLPMSFLGMNTLEPAFNWLARQLGSGLLVTQLLVMLLTIGGFTTLGLWALHYMAERRPDGTTRRVLRLLGWVGGVLLVLGMMVLALLLVRALMRTGG